MTTLELVPMNKRGKLWYPGHKLKPEDLLTFIELKIFTRIWTRLNLTDDDLLFVQLAIMCDPHGAPVIANCAGVRKLRFVPAGVGSGKRDAMRCCYKFFEEHHVVVLALPYPKSIKEELTPDDKKRIRNAIAEIEKDLNKE